MNILPNLDLLSVGIAVASTLILGFTIFFNKRESVTNKSFLFFAVITSFWGLVNYLSYQIFSDGYAFWFLRLSLFFAAWQAFALFQLFLVFPGERANYPKYYKSVVIPLVILVSLLTLTPLVLSHISAIDASRRITEVQNGPGIAVFGLFAVGLVLSALILLFRKIMKAPDSERRPFRMILIGTLIMFALIIAFNFILPAFLANAKFQPFGALFTLPFVALTGYAIIRHHFLNVKIISTEILTFVLSVVAFAEVIIAKDFVTLIFRGAVFVLILGFGILLIRSVMREVEQREQLQKLSEELKTANAKLEDLSRFKTRLLSLASHQLKSPLASIKGFAELILEGDFGEIGEKARETLLKMKRSADDLLGLINTLLDLRKVEEGRMEYSLVKTDIVPIITALVEELRPLALAKSLEFKFKPPSGSVFVSADAQKLKQVFQNLTDNAIKYTPKGFVRVSLEASKDSCVFSVTDSGLGIAKELLPQLFEEFVRDERVKREILGTGFGLYIAKKIVEAHEGKIWAESDGRDKGSRFFVQLKII